LRFGFPALSKSLYAFEYAACQCGGYLQNLVVEAKSLAFAAELWRQMLCSAIICRFERK
jgi:hypothetical protein